LTILFWQQVGVQPNYVGRLGFYLFEELQGSLELPCAKELEGVQPLDLWYVLFPELFVLQVFAQLECHLVFFVFLQLFNLFDKGDGNQSKRSFQVGYFYKVSCAQINNFNRIELSLRNTFLLNTNVTLRFINTNLFFHFLVCIAKVKHLILKCI